MTVPQHTLLAEAPGPLEPARRYFRADPDLSPGAPSSPGGSDALLREYQLSRAPHLLDQIVQVNDGLLHHVLKRFTGSGESYDDMYQVARLGLVKAVQRFDPRRGTTFSTYAVAIVDGEVRHHLRDCLLVREPRWARSLYAHIQEAQDTFYGTTGPVSHHR